MYLPLLNITFLASTNFYSLISQFLPLTDPLPPNTFSLGPEGFDLKDLRITISCLGFNVEIPVFLPGSLYPYLVPVQLFYNMFPSTFVVLEELPPSPEPSE